MDLEKILEETAFDLIRFATTELPEDVKHALLTAYERETSEIGKKQLAIIIKNFQLAEENRVPICQDTGLLEFHITIGDSFNPSVKYFDSLIKATRRATAEIPLRPNIVHPLTRKNSSDNTGLDAPIIDCEIVEGDFMDILVIPKGAGSENMNRLIMLNPTEGLKGVKKFVVDSVIDAGSKPCPPTIIGVGLGGSSDYVMKLAKKAATRPLDSVNADEQLHELEKEFTEIVNMTGIGPMGLGGSTTTLGIKVERADCHTASLPVGFVMQCWAARRAGARIYEDGTVKCLTHKEELRENC
jgi:fumarate hydratase subunit alpha